jgi:hypothetical protein
MTEHGIRLKLGTHGALDLQRLVRSIRERTGQSPGSRGLTHTPCGTLAPVGQQYDQVTASYPVMLQPYFQAALHSKQEGFFKASHGEHLRNKLPLWVATSCRVQVVIRTLHTGSIKTMRDECEYNGRCVVAFLDVHTVTGRVTPSPNEGLVRYSVLSSHGQLASIRLALHHTREQQRLILHPENHSILIQCYPMAQREAFFVADRSAHDNRWGH